MVVGAGPAVCRPASRRRSSATRSRCTKPVRQRRRPGTHRRERRRAGGVRRSRPQPGRRAHARGGELELRRDGRRWTIRRPRPDVVVIATGAAPARPRGCRPSRRSRRATSATSSTAGPARPAPCSHRRARLPPVDLGGGAAGRPRRPRRGAHARAWSSARTWASPSTWRAGTSGPRPRASCRRTDSVIMGVSTEHRCALGAAPPDRRDGQPPRRLDRAARSRRRPADELYRELKAGRRASWRVNVHRIGDAWPPAAPMPR